jgi:hypothetical protein
VAAQKTLERLVDGEEGKDRARVREHYHEPESGRTPRPIRIEPNAPQSTGPLRPRGWSAGDRPWPSPPGGSDAPSGGAARRSRYSRGSSPFRRAAWPAAADTARACRGSTAGTDRGGSRDRSHAVAPVCRGRSPRARCHGGRRGPRR